MSAARKGKMRLSEAMRGDARRVVEIKRLPDGQFAPKGLGEVLRPGQTVAVPHKSGKGMVTGVVAEGGPKGKFKVELKDGPDAGQSVVSHAEGLPASDEDWDAHRADALKKGGVPGQTEPKSPGGGKAPGWSRVGAQEKVTPGNDDPGRGRIGGPRFGGSKTSKPDKPKSPGAVGPKKYGAVTALKDKVTGRDSGAEFPMDDRSPKALRSLDDGQIEKLTGKGIDPQVRANAVAEKQRRAKKSGVPSLSSVRGAQASLTAKRSELQKQDKSGGGEHPMQARRRKGAGEKAYSKTLQDTKSFEKASAAQKQAEQDYKPPPQSPGGKVGSPRAAARDAQAQQMASDAQSNWKDRYKAPAGNGAAFGAGAPTPDAEPPMPQSPGGEVGRGGGLQPNSEGKSLKDIPLGSTFTLPNGEEYVLHKAVGDPWMIMKPTDGGKAKPIHKMLAPPTIDTSTAYDPAEAGAAAPSAPEAPAPYVPTHDPTTNPSHKQDHPSKFQQSGSSIADSPGRGPTGKLRNFNAMGKPKLKGVIAELEKHGGDPEALNAAKASAAAKGMQIPESPKQNFDQMVQKGAAATYPDGTPKPSAAPKGSPSFPGGVQKGMIGVKSGTPKPSTPKASAPAAPAGPSDLESQLQKSVDMAKKGTLPKKGAAPPKKAPAPAPAPAKATPAPTAAPQAASAPAASNGNPEAAALNAYKAAGGNDPAVIEQLTPKATAGNAALEAYQAAGGNDPAVIEMLKKAA